MVKNKWVELTQMAVPRYKTAHITVSGRLFIVGGRNEHHRKLNSVECYEPSTSSWQTVAPMRHKKTRPAIYASEGFI